MNVAMTQKSKCEVIQEEQFEKRFSSKWYEAYFMLPSLMVSVMVFFMIWFGAPGNESSLVMVTSASVFVAIALAISTGVFSAFRKKILLQEEKINNLQQQIKSLVDGS